MHKKNNSPYSRPSLVNPHPINNTPYFDLLTLPLSLNCKSLMRNSLTKLPFDIKHVLDYLAWTAIVTTIADVLHVCSFLNFLRYIKKDAACGDSESSSSSSTGTDLSISEIGGIFLISFLGLIIGIVLSVLECFFAVKIKVG